MQNKKQKYLIFCLQLDIIQRHTVPSRLQNISSSSITEGMPIILQVNFHISHTFPIPKWSLLFKWNVRLDLHLDLQNTIVLIPHAGPTF